jgi:GAF domain-containing protein
MNPSGHDRQLGTAGLPRLDLSETDGAGRATADRFAQLAVELHGSTGVGETIEAVVHFALQALSCSHAGVALAVRGRRPEVPAVTDPLVAEIYQCQLDSGEGPLVEAMRSQATVLVRDTAEDQGWPQWSEQVLALGVRSVLDVPLTTSSAGIIGVLGLYSSEPDAFTTDDEAIAHILARHASIAVASARHDETMVQAVDARKLVGQAMGILMERYDIDGDRAFEVLKRYSQSTNTKLRDVAQQLILTRRLPH